MTSIGLEKFDSLISLVTYFKDNDTCKSFLVKQRWADGDYICPYCGHHHCFRRADGNGLGCGDYYGINMDKVGIWAYDRLGVTNKRPHYKKIKVEFKEKY